MLRTLAKALGALIFVTALALAIFSAAMAQFTDYLNVKGPVTDLLASTMSIEPGDTEQILSSLKSGCANTSEPTITQAFVNLTITLECADVNATDVAGVPRLLAAGLFDQFYYKDYGCSYVECLRAGFSGPDSLVVFASDLAHKFYASLMTYMLLIAVLGGVLMAWGAGTVAVALRAFGWSGIVTGIGYFAMGPIRSVVSVPAELQAAVYALLDPIFATISQYYMYALVAGVVLLAAGYGLGFFQAKKKPEK